MNRCGIDKIERRATMKRETERAVLVNDGDKSIWPPKSRSNVDGDEYPERDRPITLTVAEWLAKDKELL